MDPSVGGLLVRVGEKLLTELARHAGDSLHGTPIERAIGAVQTEFGPEVVVDDALTAWCQAASFQQLLEDFVAGRRDLAKSDITASFIEHGGFYHPDSERLPALAECVVDRFWILLERELLESPSGHAVIAGRQETLADDIRHHIDQLPDRVVEAFKGSLTPSVSDVPGGGDPGLQAQVDAARDLLNSGHPSAARTILEGVVGKLATLPNAELEFRVETNLGAAALALDQMADARRHFAAALRLQPTSSRALANMSQLEMLQGDPSRALDLAREAWEVQPDSHSAIAVVLALHANHMRDELDTLVADNPWLESDPDGVAVLGQLDLDDDHCLGAIERLRKAANARPQDPKVMVLLAVALTREVQGRLRNEPPLSWRMATADRNALVEAERLLTQASEILAPREPRSAYIETIALRAGLRMMTGRSAEAAADAERVLTEDPDHVGALQAKGISLLSTDASAAAEYLARGRSHESADPAISQALAHAYEQAGRLEEAAELLSSIRGGVAGSRDDIDIAGALMRVLWTAEQHDDARTMEREITDAWPDDPLANLTLARFAAVRGDDDRAARLMREALGSATGPLQNRIAVEFAQFSIEREQWADGAELLESVIGDSAPLELRQRYAMCLFNAGRLKDALGFAQGQRGSGPSIPIITDIEAEILERISDLRGARGLWEKIAAEHPARVGALLRAVAAAHTYGDSVGARELLKRVDERAILDDAIELMQLAQLRTALREPDALPPAYRSRRLRFGDAKLHLAYIGSFLWRGDHDAALLNVEEAGPDTTVRLARGERSEVRTIEDDDPDAAHGEIGTEDPVARRLIGRRVGDEIVMKSGGLEELTYEIAEIKSKYVHAFQESISQFSTMFPDHPGIDTIQVSDTDLSQFLRALDLQSERATEVLEMYAEKHIPAAMVARLMGRRQIDVWRGLWSAADLSVFVSTGSADDRNRELTNASRAGVVLDLTAILTVDDLAVWEPLKRLYGRLVVPQAVVEEIRDHLREHDRMRPTGFAAKVGEQYTMQDVSAEQLAAERSHLQGLLARLEENTEVISAPGLLDLAPHELQRLDAALGGGSLAAAHIARREDLVLYADDLGLRQLARGEWGVEGTWTQPVLSTARDRSLIDPDAYRSVLARLAEWRFHVVELAVEDLVALLAVEGAPETPNSVRVANFAFGKDFLDAYAVQLAAEVIRELWIRPLVAGRKHVLLALILSSLVRGRDGNQTISALLQRLKQRVVLLIDREEIIGSVALWARERDKNRIQGS